MEKFKEFIKFIIISAISYWVTDALIHWSQPPHWLWISFLTFGVPLVIGVVWYFFSRKKTIANYPKAFPLSMIIGIWMMSPLAIAIIMQPLGGEFLDFDNLGSLLFMWSIFPIATFMMSTYSGSLGGLIITTLMLIIIALVAGVRYSASNIRLKSDQQTATQSANR